MEVSNSTIVAKIDGLKELVELQFAQNTKEHKFVNNHLETLNGSVARNNKHRIESEVLNDISSKHKNTLGAKIKAFALVGVALINGVIAVLIAILS